jgi:Tetratricopeptide repeat
VTETSLRVLGQEHLDTLNSIGILASTFWNQGRWKEAEELDVQVMETRKRVLGQEHLDTLTASVAVRIGLMLSHY